MNLKIHGGTPRHAGPSLCHQCKFATVVRGERTNEEILRCGMLRERVTFRVTSCTSFLDQHHPSVYEMEEIAWVLRTDATRKRVGFVHAKKLPWNERHVIDDE